MKFHHIGLFVADLDVGRRHLQGLLPIASTSTVIEDVGLKVRVQFCTDQSGVRYELVAPFGEGNPVDGALASGKGILNHVAYTVADLDAALTAVRAQGCIPLGRPQPAVAFGGQRVMFFMSPQRFIIELIEGEHA